MTLAFPTRSDKLNDAATALIRGAATDKLDWKNVDTDTLPPQLKALYDEYKAAQAHATKCREAFEDHTCGPIAKLMSAKAGQDVVFGYRFGKLSVALTFKATKAAPANSLRFG